MSCIDNSCIDNSCIDNSCKDSCIKDVSRGCMFCNCESEPTATICDSCFKLHSTNWLSGLPDMQNDNLFEVRFKNTRRSYYHNVHNLPLKRGDVVAVEAQPGHDIGIISLTGDLVAKQMKRVGFTPMNGEFKKIYRKAKPYDIQRWQEAIALEYDTMMQARKTAEEMGLAMKIGDVEYQGDRIKAIFYYIADERVDFRDLIKVFAQQFRIRVEMKQIGARQEAGRIGGIGSCGRELCCASWIANFVSVTTNAARTQEISLNPQKLAGQCSKLKCCLIYEIDNYIDARREFPRIHQPLQALDGDYHLYKNDIMARTMSFSTNPSAPVGIKTLTVERVKEIIRVNKMGKKVEVLDDSFDSKVINAQENDFVNVIGEESITRFDKEQEQQSSPKRKRPNRRKQRSTEEQGGEQNRAQNGKESRVEGEERNKKARGQKRRQPTQSTQGDEKRGVASGEKDERGGKNERSEKGEKSQRRGRKGSSQRGRQPRGEQRSEQGSAQNSADKKEIQ